MCAERESDAAYRASPYTPPVECAPVGEPPRRPAYRLGGAGELLGEKPGKGGYAGYKIVMTV
ncbi:hypothetical protein D5H75_23970 [Bailinhaonella thermotolerans]|uniref:Uncharacterized protein n=1 Tax=Bailinhaonella thermotolerans TaxID=1070861 RepID=A0A3A4AXK3_9ACTN|nr:hypothetical protein D5H75_23970 [Bailinhaonella thermotolerans]